MKTTLSLVCTLFGLCISSALYAVGVRVTPMSSSEAAFYLDGIQSIGFSSDYDSALPVIIFLDENGTEVKNHVVSRSTKLTFSTEAVENATASKKTLSFYPNPSTDFIYVRGLEHSAHARIYDARGLLVMNQETSGTINVSSLAPGTYVLHIENTYFKIIIQ